jgi:hypothetical protein
VSPLVIVVIFRLESLERRSVVMVQGCFGNSECQASARSAEPICAWSVPELLRRTVRDSVKLMLRLCKNG